MINIRDCICQSCGILIIELVSDIVVEVGHVYSGKGSEPEESFLADCYSIYHKAFTIEERIASRRYARFSDKAHAAAWVVAQITEQLDAHYLSLK